MSDEPREPSLYTARLDDPRERAAQPRERSRGRAAPRAEPTSDTRRFRGVLPATLAGAVTALVAALVLSPSARYAGPGPLSLPHEKAGLTCASCHGQSTPEAKGAADACTGCHGPHPSLRAGHARQRALGTMTCATCHPVHRSDQGVAFATDGSVTRFAPGVTVDLGRSAFQPARAATVAVPTAESCAQCHDLSAPRDPIAHCLLGGESLTPSQRPIGCLDEHQSALPDDRRPPPVAARVCAAQHGTDRAAAWEAAREVVAASPAVARPPLRGGSLSWMLAGLAASVVTLAGARVRDRALARRRKKEAELAAAALVKPVARVRLPQIDTSRCLGCYACVDACPYDVLEVDKYVAVVARPEACCGLTLCEQRCPNGSLRITDGDPIGDRPRLEDSLESRDAPGVFLAGDVTGLPLIKNAIHQGALAASRIAESLRGSPSSRPSSRDARALDLVIVGSGPAGLSAALRAKELGLTYEVLEQGTVAESIKSFPRGKLVFDPPLELPVAGKLWLEESTKEELLSHWLRIVRKEKLPIREGERMTEVRKDGDLFEVVTIVTATGAEATRLARRVLLAIGQRGTPRKLGCPVPPEAEDRVHYRLFDAKSFEGRRVVVVGLGDVAMEAAIALSRQPGTTVTVVARARDFSRGSSRNIGEMKRLAASGRVAMRWESEVATVSRSELRLRSAAGESRESRESREPYDALLVLIGSIPPKDLLERAGVRTS